MCASCCTPGAFRCSGPAVCWSAPIPPRSSGGSVAPIPLSKKARSRHWALIFTDEASFRQDSTLHATWSRVGCPPEIPVTGERKNIKILGAIELWRTRFDYRQDTVFNATAYLGFLEQLARRYRRQGAILIQDNASYHKDAEVWAWFKSNRHWLEVHQLPPYSPELNPTERLWQHTRKNGTHNRFFGGPDARHYRSKQAAAFQLRTSASTFLFSVGSFACSRLSWRRSFNSLLGRKVAFWLAAIC